MPKPPRGLYDKKPNAEAKLGARLTAALASRGWYSPPSSWSEPPNFRDDIDREYEGLEKYCVEDVKFTYKSRGLTETLETVVVAAPIPARQVRGVPDGTRDLDVEF